AVARGTPTAVIGAGIVPRSGEATQREAAQDPVIAALALDHQPARFGRSGSGGVSTTATGSGSGAGSARPGPLSADGPSTRAGSVRPPRSPNADSWCRCGAWSSF